MKLGSEFYHERPIEYIPPVVSRRDYFAAAALQGFLASSDDISGTAIIKTAVKFADAIIAELDKSQHEKNHEPGTP